MYCSANIITCDNVEIFAKESVLFDGKEYEAPIFDSRNDVRVTCLSTDEFGTCFNKYE